jgi:hypothetical protein
MNHKSHHLDIQEPSGGLCITQADRECYETELDQGLLMQYGARFRLLHEVLASLFYAQEQTVKSAMGGLYGRP